MSAPLASVAVGRPVRGEFTYEVPPALDGRLRPGQRILVPFGRGKALGFYLGPATTRPDASVALKAIVEILDEEPAVAPDVLRLAPPLVLTTGQADEVLSILPAVLDAAMDAA